MNVRRTRFGIGVAVATTVIAMVVPASAASSTARIAPLRVR
jgi:hypothetical protein